MRQADQRLAQGHGAIAGRVDQHAVELAQRDQVVRRHFEQVARGERGFFRQAISQGVFQRPLRQGGAAFDAHHFAALRGQRQGEIAQAAEQVGHAIGRLHFQQAQRFRHQHAVDVMVHLRKIDGLERHLDAEFRQQVVQLLVQRIERHGRFRPLHLQPPLHAVLVGERLQLRFIVRRQRRHDAQDHGGDVFAHGQLDLRHLVEDRQRADQRAQRQQHGGNVRRQDFAAIHVGNEGRFLFMEAHQHGIFLFHMAHGQARAVAVAPRRAIHGAHDALRTHLADVPQVIFQHALLDRHLRRRFQVLHGAAAAIVEMLALGRHAHRRFAVQRRHARHFPVLLFLVRHKADALARQCAFDKHDLARRAVFVLNMANATGVHVERFDFDDIFLHSDQ